MDVALSNTPQLGAPPQRMTVDAELVRRLKQKFGAHPPWFGYEQMKK